MTDKKKEDVKPLSIKDATGQLDWQLMEQEFLRRAKAKLSKVMDIT